VVLTIGQVVAGENPNVIPEYATLRGTLRTLTRASRERTKDHIRRIATALAEASGTHISVEFEVGPQSVENDRPLTELLRDTAAEVLGPDNLEIVQRPSMGGEDFAFYLDHVPGAMFRLGCASPEAGNAPLHSPHFDIDERALVIGARILARAVVAWSDPRGRFQQEL
jgi:amidohydrolase